MNCVLHSKNSQFGFIVCSEVKLKRSIDVESEVRLEFHLRGKCEYWVFLGRVTCVSMGVGVWGFGGLGAGERGASVFGGSTCGAEGKRSMLGCRGQLARRKTKEFVIYASIATAGYLSFGASTKQDFIRNYPADDGWMLLVRCVCLAFKLEFP